MARVLTDSALEKLDMLPPFAQQDFQIQAAVQAMANECDRIDGYFSKSLQLFFPFLATDYLYLWEAALGISVDPSQLTDGQRQARVMAMLLIRAAHASGATWIALLNTLVGPTWSYTRWDPPAGDAPPQNTIILNLPYAEGSAQDNDIRKLIAIIAPANTVFGYSYGSGFIIQESGIQEQPL